MRFDVAIAAEVAIQQYNRAGNAGAKADIPNVFRGARTAIEQHLRAVWRKFSGLRGALMFGFAIDDHVLRGDAAAIDANAVHRFFNQQIAQPGILGIHTDRAKMFLGMADGLRRRFDAQVFDPNLRNTTGWLDLHYW